MRTNHDDSLNRPFAMYVLWLTMSREHQCRKNGCSASTVDKSHMLIQLYVCKLLYHHGELDELLDQRICRLFACSACELRFRISVDRQTPFRCSTTKWDAPYSDGFAHEPFHAMLDFHRRVFDYGLEWHHDRQANGNHAMDNHFGWMNARAREVLKLV
jgi:hypothetical protein